MNKIVRNLASFNPTGPNEIQRKILNIVSLAIAFGIAYPTFILVLKGGIVVVEEVLKVGALGIVPFLFEMKKTWNIFFFFYIGFGALVAIEAKWGIAEVIWGPRYRKERKDVETKEQIAAMVNVFSPWVVRP